MRRNPADYEKIGFSDINLGTRATDTCIHTHSRDELFFLNGEYRMLHVKGLVDMFNKKILGGPKKYRKKIFYLN